MIHYIVLALISIATIAFLFLHKENSALLQKKNAATTAQKSQTFEPSSSASKNVKAATKDGVENMALDALISEFKKPANPDESSAARNARRSRLISRIAKIAGYDAAIELLDAEIGFGSDKDSLLTALFSGLEENVSVTLQRFNNFKGSGYRAAVAGFMKNVESGKLSGAQLATVINEIDYVMEGRSMEEALMKMFARTKSPEDLLAKANELTSQLLALKSDPEKTKTNIHAVLEGVARKDPLAAIDVLSKLQYEGKAEHVEYMLGNFLSWGLARTDPIQSTEKLKKSGLADSKMQKRVFDNWMSWNGPGEVDTWLENNKGKISPELYDSAKLAGKISNQEPLNYKKRLEMLGEMKDPELREINEEQIRSSEARSINETYADKPQEAIDQIVSGNSIYTDQAVEPAVTLWLQKDPAAANEWYEKKSSDLRPEQVQYVASAFALEALRLRDFELAQKWAGQIKDEMTLKKFNEALLEKQKK